MTSSLVGSEMCIRDSNRSAFGMIVAELVAAALQGRQAQLAQRCTSQSVSYTHLTLPTICSV
eukprot:3920963-Prorocentrum_lima.AAC.1